MRVLYVDGTNIVMRYASARWPGVSASDPALPPDDVERVCRDVWRVCQRAAELAGATHVVVALDSPAQTWRAQRYPAYKAQRNGHSSIWSQTLETYLQDGGRALCVRAPGYEADDIIATLVGRAVVCGYAAAAFSGDSDLLQLASPQCAVYQFGRKGEPAIVRRDARWIAEKYGIVSPAQLMLYKALVGEAGDNLPGVRGIGPTKARRLLRYHDSIDTLVSYGAVDRAQLTLMAEMVTLRTDVPVPPISPASCRLRSMGQEGAR